MVSKPHNSIKKGFTLIELLIVGITVTILTSVAFVGYRTRQKEIALQKEANFLVVKIEEAKEMAISSKYFHGSLPEGGYGVYFNIGQANQFIIFADCNGNNFFDSTGTPCSGHPEWVERIDLEEKTYIKNLCAPSVSITFIPPTPNVFIKTSSGALLNECVVTLGVQGSSKGKKIHFNSAGLVYVE